LTEFIHTFGFVNLPISTSETVVLSASGFGQGTLGHAATEWLWVHVASLNMHVDIQCDYAVYKDHCMSSEIKMRHSIDKCITQ